MPRSPLPKSVRLSAAASVVACTAGMTGQTAQAAAMPVWIDHPAAEGVYTPDEAFDRLLTVDFDSDGKIDFSLYYYFGFRFDARSTNTGDAIYNQSSDILHEGIIPTDPFPRQRITASIFDNRDEVFAAALGYTPFPESVTYIFTSPDVGSLTDSRGLLGGTFEGGDGSTYAGYFDFEIVTDNNLGVDSLTIYDAGFALIPEPSSLAFLCLGGLLLARRRRDS